MEHCTLLVSKKKNPISHSQGGHFLTNFSLDFLQPHMASWSLKFSHICPLPVNLKISKYSICVLGNQLSFLIVGSDLTDISMGSYLLQQTQTIKRFCYRIQSSSLGEEDIVVSWNNFFLLFIFLNIQRKKFKGSPARSYRPVIS